MKPVKEPFRAFLLVTMYPPSMASARLMTAAWAVALLAAVVGVVLNFGAWTSFALWFNAAVAALDIYMLRLCIHGVRFRRHVNRPRRRA